MTLEEAIKHCEEVAEEKEREAEYRQETQGDMFKFLDDLSKSVGGEGIENDALNECLECASEHRQLAEWLRELKAYREFADWLVKAVLEEDWEESADFYAEVLCRKLTKLGKLKVVDNKYMEVNADE